MCQYKVLKLIVYRIVCQMSLSEYHFMMQISSLKLFIRHVIECSSFRIEIFLYALLSQI